MTSNENGYSVAPFCPLKKVTAVSQWLQDTAPFSGFYLLHAVDSSDVQKQYLYFNYAYSERNYSVGLQNSGVRCLIHRNPEKPLILVTLRFAWKNQFAKMRMAEIPNSKSWK